MKDQLTDEDIMLAAIEIDKGEAESIDDSILLASAVREFYENQLG